MEKINLSEQVFEVIKSRIVKGEVGPGEKLPSENALSEEFGVNRLTVRMAIQKLNAFGLVETRAGEGTFVKKFSFKNYVEEISDLFITPDMLEDVCDFRKHIEIECARLAIAKYDETEIKVLEQLCRKISEVPKITNYITKEGLKQAVEADLNFHYQIVKMSKNSLYTLAFNVSREVIKQYLCLIVPKRIETFIEKGKMTKSGEYTNGVDLHELLFNAIKDKDFQATKRIYIKMIDFRIDDPTIF